MVKIIETNYNEESFQSRIIEVESWEYVIKQFTEEEIKAPKIHRDIFNSEISGAIRPKMSTIENLKYDYFRLSCDVIYNCGRIKKLIQLIEN